MPDSESLNTLPAVNIKDDPFRIVFVCFGNACRSQMAEGFARRQAPAWVEASSSGLTPLGFVPEEIVAVMAEQGIEVEHQSSSGIDTVEWGDVSLLVDMVGIPDGLIPDTVPMLAWEIEDPFGGPVEEFRRVRDLISGKVDELIGSLKEQRG